MKQHKEVELTSLFDTLIRQNQSKKLYHLLKYGGTETQWEKFPECVERCPMFFLSKEVPVKSNSLLKNLLLGIIAVSMMLFTGCGKLVELIQPQPQIIEKTVIVEKEVPAKQQDTSNNTYLYCAATTVAAITLVALTAYFSYTRGVQAGNTITQREIDEAYDRGLEAGEEDSQMKIETAYKQGEFEGNKKGMEWGYQQGLQQGRLIGQYAGHVLGLCANVNMQRVIAQNPLPQPQQPQQPQQNCYNMSEKEKYFMMQQQLKQKQANSSLQEEFRQGNPPQQYQRPQQQHSVRRNQPQQQAHSTGWRK
jgi:hypothetical protein